MLAYHPQNRQCIMSLNVMNSRCFNHNEGDESNWLLGNGKFKLIWAADTSSTHIISIKISSSSSHQFHLNSYICEHVRQPDNIVLVTHIASKLIMFFPEANFMHQLTHTWSETFTHSLTNGCLQRKLFSGKLSTLIRTVTRCRGVSIIALCGKHDSALICHLYSHILSIFDSH